MLGQNLVLKKKGRPHQQQQCKENDIPFEETKNYVSKVNKEIATYKNLYSEVTEND